MLRDVEAFGRSRSFGEGGPPLNRAEQRQLQLDLGVSGDQDLSGSFAADQSYRGAFHHRGRGPSIGLPSESLRRSTVDAGTENLSPGYAPSNFVIRPFDNGELRRRNAQQMRKLPGSEEIIEKVLEMLDCDPTDDLLGWPPDGDKSNRACLSESKMLNEVAQREPRTTDSKGQIT